MPGSVAARLGRALAQSSPLAPPVLLLGLNRGWEQWLDWVHGGGAGLFSRDGDQIWLSASRSGFGMPRGSDERLGVSPFDPLWLHLALPESLDACGSPDPGVRGRTRFDAAWIGSCRLGLTSCGRDCVTIAYAFAWEGLRGGSRGFVCRSLEGWEGQRLVHPSMPLLPCHSSLSWEGVLSHLVALVVVSARALGASWFQASRIVVLRLHALPIFCVPDVCRLGQGCLGGIAGSLAAVMIVVEASGS